MTTISIADHAQPHAPSTPKTTPELNICLSANAKFYEGLETALASVVVHSHQNTESFNFFIIDGGFTNKQLTQLRNLVSRLKKNHSTQISLSLQKLDTEASAVLSKFRDSPTFYVRLILANLIPDKDWVIWMDSDIFCMKDQSSLTQYFISSVPISGVIDYTIGTLANESKGCEAHNSNQFNLETPYINTGFVVMNLKLWRNEKLPAKLIDWGKIYNSQTRFRDQSIINWNLADRIRHLPASYNVIVDQLQFDSIENFPLINYHMAGHYKPWLLNFKFGLKFGPLLLPQLVASYLYLKLRHDEMGYESPEPFIELNNVIIRYHSFLKQKSLASSCMVKAFLYKISRQGERATVWQRKKKFYQHDSANAIAITQTISREIEKCYLK